jgi:hypothetical protein
LSVYNRTGVKHRVKWLYYFGSIFPFLAVCVCWSIYYGKKHNTTGVIETISGSVVPFPEFRIFAVAMNIEGWVLGSVLAIRNNILMKIAKSSGLASGFRYAGYVWTMHITSAASVIGVMGVSAVTLADHSGVHGIFAFLFFVGIILYNLVSDGSFKYVRRPVNIYSYALSWFSISLGGMYAVFVGAFQNQQKLSNAGSIFQYLTSLCIFVKVFMYQYDVPSHYIGVNWND